MSQTLTHDEQVKQLETHLTYFAICPCCGHHSLAYLTIPRAKMTFLDLSCSDCTFTGSIKVWK